MVETGQMFTWARTFTIEDVHTFSQISGDEGTQHVVPDIQGRLMVQGLLTATLPSKIGGDLNFIASEMRFHFHQPVFTGDLITCTISMDEIDQGPERIELGCSWSCENQSGELVMTGGSHGVIRTYAAPLS